MSIVQDFDLTNLDRLLRTFTERPQALNLDTQLPVLMQALQADHLDLLPLPGQGHTLQRWQTLARIAGCDLALAKLYEGHTDALAILAECGAPHGRRRRLGRVGRRAAGCPGPHPRPS